MRMRIFPRARLVSRQVVLRGRSPSFRDDLDGQKNTIFWSQKGCGPSAVIATAHGEFLTTCYDNGTIGRISADGKTLPPYTHDKDGNPFVGPNDFAPMLRAAYISLRPEVSRAR